MSFKNVLILVVSFVMLTACDPPAELSEKFDPIGDFRVGFIKITAENTQSLIGSRELEKEQLEQILIAATRERLGRYKGKKWYHIQMVIDGIFLAPRGIPIIASPRSAMVIKVVIWDDTAGKPLNDEPKSFAIAEPFSAPTFVGSGYIRDEEEQAVALARHAAAVIEGWLKSSEESPLPAINHNLPSK